MLYIKCTKKYGPELRRYYRHFAMKSAQQVNNFWMNHRNRGLMLSSLCERRDRLLKTDRVGGRRLYKGMTFILDKNSK